MGKVAIVDAADFEELSKFHWIFRRKGYAVRNPLKGIGETQQVYMHRQILNAPRGFDVDHINRDGLDNRRLNLRICTHAQNIQNSKLSTRNKTGFKGVHFSNTVGKFVAQIGGKNRSKHFLGFFPTAQEAGAAYAVAAQAAYGEFTRLT